MKAIRVHQFGGPEVLEIEEIPDPTPGLGQVVVRIEAAGVNPVDLAIRMGKYTEEPPLPYTPGNDGAGVVEAVGEDVSAFRVGDRVWVYGRSLGTSAEKVICPVAAVHRLPDKVRFAEGAAVGTPASAAWRALFLRGDARAGETVLMHGGTGSVGVSAIQLARAAGLSVIATASDDSGLQFAKEQGAHHVAFHNDYDAMRGWTEGKGVALILEEDADKNLNDDLAILAANGRVVVIGSHDATQIDPRHTMTTELDIRGMSLGNASPEQEASTAAALTAALEAGILRPVVGKELPLAEAAQAHQFVEKGGLRGKVILTPF